MEQDALPALSLMLRQTIGDRLSPDARTFPEMCAADVVFEAPYAPGGWATLNGREAVAAYLPKVADDYRIERLTPTATYTTNDPEVVILEFEAEGRGARTDRPYPQKYINVVRIRDRRIVAYRDYWNPLVALWTADREGIPARLAGKAG